MNSEDHLSVYVELVDAIKKPVEWGITIQFRFTILNAEWARKLPTFEIDLLHGHTKLSSHTFGKSCSDRGFTKLIAHDVLQKIMSDGQSNLMIRTELTEQPDDIMTNRAYRELVNDLNRA